MNPICFVLHKLPTALGSKTLRETLRHPANCLCVQSWRWRSCRWIIRLHLPQLKERDSKLHSIHLRWVEEETKKQKIHQTCQGEKILAIACPLFHILHFWGADQAVLNTLNTSGTFPAFAAWPTSGLKKIKNNKNLVYVGIFCPWQQWRSPYKLSNMSADC